nr:MAG TPA: hypothetical protein [Caudoviricetes sp.]DAX25025.1 MAG TPA: hypothetical protein [Caudoviricetes sp.]
MTFNKLCSKIHKNDRGVFYTSRFFIINRGIA